MNGKVFALLFIMIAVLFFLGMLSAINSGIAIVIAFVISYLLG